MTKKEYVAGVVAELTAAGMTVDENILKRGIERAARHMRNKYGCADWQMEHDESGFGNGVCFYNETLRDGGNPKANTFNRGTARNRS